MFRRLVDGLAQDRIELAKGFRGDGLQQCLAVGKVPVGRRLRHAQFFRQRLQADRFRAALLGFAQRGLHQGVAEITMVVGILRLAGEPR